MFHASLTHKIFPKGHGGKTAAFQQGSDLLSTFAEADQSSCHLPKTEHLSG